MSRSIDPPKDEFSRPGDVWVGAGIWVVILGALWAFAGVSPPEALWIWLRNGVWAMQPEQLGNLGGFDNTVGAIVMFAVWYVGVPVLPVWLGCAVMADSRRVRSNPRGYGLVFAVFAVIGGGLVWYAASRGTL